MSAMSQPQRASRWPSGRPRGVGPLDWVDPTLAALRRVREFDGEVTTARVAEAMGLSRQCVSERLQRLVVMRRIIASGSTSERRFEIVEGAAAPAVVEVVAVPSTWAVPTVAMRATLDDVVCFLRGRGISVRGGPVWFLLDGVEASAGEVLGRANLIREALRKPPLALV